MNNFEITDSERTKVEAFVNGPDNGSADVLEVLFREVIAERLKPYYVERYGVRFADGEVDSMSVYFGREVGEFRPWNRAEAEAEIAAVRHKIDVGEYEAAAYEPMVLVKRTESKHDEDDYTEWEDVEGCNGS